jgi:hypothetical protein
MATGAAVAESGKLSSELAPLSPTLQERLHRPSMPWNWVW